MMLLMMFIKTMLNAAMIQLLLTAKFLLLMVTFMKHGPVCDLCVSTNRLRVGYLASAGQLGDRCLEGDEDDFLTSQTIDVGLMGGQRGSD